MPTPQQVLRPYQREDVQWLAASAADNPNRLLVDDPGLGKTAIAINAAHRINATNVLVACPAVARLVWDAELARWWPPVDPLPRIYIIQPGATGNNLSLAARLALIPRPGWTIIAYSALSLVKEPWVTLLSRLAWDLLIIDECQYLKGRSNRTHAVYGARFDRAKGSLAAAAKRVWLLSGTPAPNHAGELYPHIRSLFPQILPPSIRNDTEFENRYCNVRDDSVYGRRIAGSNLQALPDLRARLRPYIMRRRRRDVARDLPPIAFYDTPIAVDAALLRSTTLRGNSTLHTTVPAIVGRLTRDGSDDKLVDVLQANEVAMATMRRLTGLLKILPAVAFIEELLEELPHSERKVVVFAYHRDVINGLAAGLVDWNAVVLDGATSPPRRAEVIKAFQEDRKVGVFVGQIQAAGVSVTLTAAHVAVFVECSWVPSENHQAALRIHRLGQDNPCTVHFLYVPASLDQRIMRAFRRKAAELAKLLN